jgi:hypothetical protein
MTCVIGKQPYRMWFHYTRVPIGMGPAAGRVFTKHVTCFIARGDEPHELAFHGRASLHPNDYGRFSKETGRKLALARALANAEFTKNERSAFWAAYINRALLDKSKVVVLACMTGELEC